MPELLDGLAELAAGIGDELDCARWRAAAAALDDAARSLRTALGIRPSYRPPG